MSNSDIATSPAIQTVDNDFVGQLLAGNTNANIAEASVVAGLYFLFGLLALFNFIRERLGAHLLLVLFCCFRIVSFSVRAYMQKHLSSNLAIVYEVFFAVGFIALVKLLVSLLSAWTLPRGAPAKRGAFSFGLLRNQGTLQERFITLILLAGMVTSIIGATDAYEGDATVKEYNKGLKLMKAGYTIYLAAIVIYDVLVITGPLLNRLNFGRPQSLRSATLVVLALEVCGLLLTCKAVFQVIAVFTNPSLIYRNKLFYPLEVLPELLVLTITCAPGFMSHVYKGSHAHPETDVVASKATTDASPAITPRSHVATTPTAANGSSTPHTARTHETV